MGTKVAIIYATASKIIYSVIDPTFDRELDDPAHVPPGRTMLVVDKTRIQPGDTFESILLREGGVTAQPPQRGVHVDNKGNVVGIYAVDLALDQPPGKAPGHVLVDVPAAEVGDHYDVATKVLTKQSKGPPA